MAAQRDPLAWSTPVNQGAIKKRGLFFMDGWLLVCPVVIPGFAGIMATSGQPQMYWLLFTSLVTTGAIALHQFNPWFLADYEIELLHTPKYMTDLPSDDPTALARFIHCIQSFFEVKP